MNRREPSSALNEFPVIDLKCERLPVIEQAMELAKMLPENHPLRVKLAEKTALAFIMYLTPMFRVGNVNEISRMFTEEI